MSETDVVPMQELPAVMKSVTSQIEACGSALANPDSAPEVDAQVVSELLAATVRLYAHASEHPGLTLAPEDIQVDTTAAVIVAAALLRSQTLSPFEFMVWFDRDSSS